MRTVHAVVPAGLTDRGRPSGGNAYDLRVLTGLGELGWTVCLFEVDGTWPTPDRAARCRLSGVLACIPDGSPVLLDGLVACAVPEVIAPERDRLRLVTLVHLPLGHEWGAGAPDGQDAARREREREVLAAATTLITTSRWTRAWLLDAYGLDPDRVHAAPPGSEEAAEARPEPSGSRLLCVGAVTPTKGHDVLLDALSRIVDLPWSLTCVGALDIDPGFVADLAVRIGRAGLDTRITLAGPCGGDRLQTMYAVADLVLVPSRIESYGMVATEALARGIPVIGSDVGGLPEALDGPTPGDRPGLLVPPGDDACLAAALREWITDPDLRDRLRAAARRRRATLDGWSATTQRVSEILDELAA